MIGGGLEEAIAATVRTAVAEALAEHAVVPRLALSVAEAATAIGKSDRYVRRLIDAGEIPARSGGPNGHLMVSVDALRSWLATADAA